MSNLASVAGLLYHPPFAAYSYIFRNIWWRLERQYNISTTAFLVALFAGYLRWDVSFFIYLDAASFGVIRHFRESILSSQMNTTVLDFWRWRIFFSDFLIASQRHGACYDSILFSTVCWLLTMRYFILIYLDAASIGVIRHFGESVLSSQINTTVWTFEDFLFLTF